MSDETKYGVWVDVVGNEMSLHFSCDIAEVGASQSGKLTKGRMFQHRDAKTLVGGLIQLTNVLQEISFPINDYSVECSFQCSAFISSEDEITKLVVEILKLNSQRFKT